MGEAGIVLVLSLLIAFLVRIFWRLVLNLLVIAGVSLVIAAVFFVVLGVQEVNDWN